MRILVLNCGSSSAKFAVFDTAAGTELVAGLAQRLGTDQAGLTWKHLGTAGEKALPGADHAAALRAVVDVLRDLGLAEGLAGIGHRVVNGGASMSASAVVTPTVEAVISDCVAISPLHNPPNLTGIRLARELFPRLPQVAVFDTSFHQTMPEVAWRYPVPRAWDAYGVRRYGFHGTSHRFVSQEARSRLGARGRRLITAHLGNGCSACAVLDGASIDTTMGLTPLEGLMMGTRAGSIDPAVVGYVAERSGQTAAKVIDALNKQSGLLGVSGVSNDLRTVSAAAASGNADAQLAIDLFTTLLAKSLAGLVVPLGGLDALVFTGGIGENAAPIRAAVLGHLAWLGLDLDTDLNGDHGRRASGRITRDSGGPIALVVPTNEELMIARDTAALVGTACAKAC